MRVFLLVGLDALWWIHACML